MLLKCMTDEHTSGILWCHLFYTCLFSIHLYIFFTHLSLYITYPTHLWYSLFNTSLFFGILLVSREGADQAFALFVKRISKVTQQR